MQIRLSSPLQSDSVVDGEGIRTVIWTQGCPHHCKGCHNPETHGFKGGFLKDINELIEEIRGLELQDGITFSGGDPMMQPKVCTVIAKACKEMGYNIWCYTGFLFEDLLDNEDRREFLNYIDVLVDGKFELDKKSYAAKFRGSTNQRLINVKASLKKNRAVVFRKYNTKGNS